MLIDRPWTRALSLWFAELTPVLRKETLTWVKYMMRHSRCSAAPPIRMGFLAHRAIAGMFPRLVDERYRLSRQAADGCSNNPDLSGLFFAHSRTDRHQGVPPGPLLGVCSTRDWETSGYDEQLTKSLIIAGRRDHALARINLSRPTGERPHGQPHGPQAIIATANTCN